MMPLKPPGDVDFEDGQRPSHLSPVAVEAERIGKIALAFGGLCFAVGFLVSVLHIGRYGALSADLAKPQYILVGLWAVAPLVLGTLLVALLLASVGDHWKAMDGWPGWLKYPLFLVGSVIGLSVAVAITQGAMMFPVVLLMSIVRRPFMAATSSMPLLGLGALVPCIVLAIHFGTRRALGSTVRQPLVPEASALKYATTTVASACLIVIVLVVYLFVFTLLVYPQIPMEIGGGKPIRVRFLLKPAPDPQQSALAQEGVTELSVPCELVAETDKSYIIRREGAEGGRLPRTLVVARDLAGGYSIDEDADD